jgi:glycosyltransferase involved in cell wall biosynthesis
MIVYQIVKYANREQYDFTICGCMKSGHYEDSLKKDGIDVESISINRRSIYLFPLFLYDVLRTLFRILSIIKSRKIDLIHTHLPDSSTYGVVAGRITGKPVVVSIHSNIIIPFKRSAPFRNWLRKRVINFIYKRADTVICCGEDVANSMIKQGHLSKTMPIEVIVNGIDNEKFARKRDLENIREGLNLPAESRVISCISRIEAPKGHTYLIGAAARLKDKYPLLRVLIVGDGTYLEELKAEVKEAGVEEQVRFLGRRSDIPDILAVSEMFVFPSLYEGLPMVVLEAMAAKRPVVATNIPGTRELVTGGEDGYLVPVKDEVSLAEKIDKLLSDPDLARSMGEHAGKKVEESFTVKMMVEKVGLVYQKILEKR